MDQGPLAKSQTDYLPFQEIALFKTQKVLSLRIEIQTTTLHTMGQQTIPLQRLARLCNTKLA